MIAVNGNLSSGLEVGGGSMMKRITITLGEDIYIRLLEYSLDRSKAELRNFSTSEAVRELLEMQMRRMGKVGRRRGRTYPLKMGGSDASPD